MKTFDVYPRFDITPKTAKGVYVYDEEGEQYLDLYGGHGVISIGHGHSDYLKSITEQVQQIGFYSNSINMPIQEELAHKLSSLSGYSNHQLFLCNSGAEANENALKLASFHTGKKKVIAFKGSFHGRTAGTLNVTDNTKLSAPINQNNFPVEFLELNKKDQLIKALENKDVCAIIVEGIQGVGGLDYPTNEFLLLVAEQCKQAGALLILDEIQSGYGRTGKFFAHQYAGIEADIVTMAKGMGNGFPIGGVLISPKIKSSYGMLGTTFGGNHLACSAGLSVLNVIEKEGLLNHAEKTSKALVSLLKEIKGIKQIKGKGLMLGVELNTPVKEIRKQLLFDYHIFTGASANPNLLRILPPLNITTQQLQPFVEALKQLLP